MKSRFLCKCLLLLSAVSILVLILYVTSEPESVACYKNRIFDENIELLEDVLASKVQPSFGRSIFFHETSCKNGIISINARQACAIESAAKANPNSDVFVLFASPVGFVKNETKSKIIQSLLLYDNIHLRNINLWSYARNSPMDKFINTKKIFQSKYLVSHLSDFLRYLSLFKWGGTYLDLDTIVKQNLESIENYVGAESSRYIAAGIINVDHGGIGNHISLECIEDFEENFDGQSWGNNGPQVITRVLRKICKTNDILKMTRDHCYGFLVMKPESMYAIGFGSWDYFFDERYTQYVLKNTNKSYVVHFWNKLSASKPVLVGSNVAYGVLASQYCPKVYASSGAYF